MAKSKAEIRERFRTQINKLAETGVAHRDAAKLKDRRLWTKIDKNGWSGDLFDLDGMLKAFARDENWQDFKDAIKDPENAGTTGDLIASQLQSEYLAVQERAFRYRHATPCRLLLHAAARSYGHGAERGVLKLAVLGYIENILKSAKSENE